MAFGIDHWNNPRGSIANKYVKNDFAYVSRGANIALYVLKEFNITPSDAKNMIILDYGCGTGRAAAFLSKIFGRSIGYDPNQYCIREAYKENEKSDIEFPHLMLTTSINDVPVCDIAFSTNVIEHLDENAQRIMIKNLREKVNGKTLLWYSPIRNKILEPYIVSNSWEDVVSSGKMQVDFFDFRL